MLKSNLFRSVRRQFARLQFASIGRWMEKQGWTARLRGRAAISRALEPMEHRVLFAGFNVTAATPASGTYLPAVPNTMELDFNANLLLSSVQASDLKVDGVSSTSYQVVNNRKVRFTLPTVGEGQHTFTVASGAMKSLQNVLISPYSGQFTVDLTAPTVTSATLTPGQVVPEGTLSMAVTFNEPLRADNISTAVVSLTSAGGDSVTPTSVTYSQSTNTLNIEFPELPGETSYTVNLASGDGKLEDLAGNDLDGDGNGSFGGDYSLTFGVNSPIGSFPAPLTAVGFAGSRVYQGSVSGAINFVDDTDDYTLSLDEGQSITLVLKPGADLRGTIELIDLNGNTVQAATSSVNGAAVVVQTASVSTAGQYTLKVSGFDSTTGSYTLDANLNAAVELETTGGPDNDALASAQDIDGAFVTLGGGASRGAVLGAMPTTTTTGTYTASTSSSGRAYNWNTVYPAISTTGLTPTGDVTFSVSGTGYNGYWYTNPGYFRFYDESGNQQRDQTVYAYNTDPINFSWTVSPSTYQSWSSDDSISSRIEWYAIDHSINYTVSYPYAQVTAASDDYYSFSLTSGQSATVALKLLSGSGVGFELIDPNGVKLADSTAGTDLDQQVADIVAATTGTYYVKVKADASQPTYNLVVTKNASIDAGANDTIAAAQDITVSGKVIGALTDGESDVFQFTASSGDVLNISTTTPATGTGEFTNGLDAKIELFDSARNSLAVSSGSPGLDETFSFPVTSTGTYYVKITAENSTTGEYTLAVDGYTKTLPAFTVTNTTIANNAQLATVPTEITVDFSTNFLPGTDSASDLTVDGVEATAVTVVDGNTLTFTLPTLTDGDHTIALSADALRNLQGTALTAFTSTFHLDTTGPTIVSTSVAQGGVVSSRSLNYDVTFNEPLKDGQLSADDFSLEAATVTSSTFNGSDQRYISQYSSTDYYINVPTDTVATGDATVTITANGAYIYNPAYFSDEDGNGRGSWYTGNYNNGQSTSLTISQADVQRYIADGQFRFRISTNGNYYPYGTFTVSLNFPYTQTTIRETYTPDSFTLSSDKKTVTLQYSGLLEDNYRLTLKSGDGQFEDVLGNDLDGDANAVNGGDAIRNFDVEYDRNAIPVPLIAVAPAGSLAYESAPVVANIGTTGDIDTWSVTVDAGQRLSVVVEPTPGSGVQPAISIFRTYNTTTGVYGSSAGSASATTPGTGAAASVTTVPNSPQIYYIRIASVSGSETTGGYSLRALTNVVYERERLNPSSTNDTIGDGGTAQALDNRLTSLGGSSNAGITTVLGAATSGSVDNYSLTLDGSDSLAVSLKQLTGSGARLEIFDAAGVRVTTGIVASGNVDRATTSLISTGGGTYYVRVTADSDDITYSLQVVRNAAFDTGGNDTPETALDISTTGNVDGTARVVGRAEAGDADYYKLTATALDNIVIGISTPASGTGEFVNTLSPSVEVFDSAGNSLASHTGTGSSILSFEAPTDGVYVVKVSAANNTAGEYALAVAGYTLTLPELTVTDISIPAGAFLNTVPTTVDVSFSGSLDLSTVDASDLIVGTVPATDVTIVDGDTVRFTLPSLGEGEHTISIDAATIVALNGVDLTAATRSFTIDLTPPRVTTTSITPGQLISAGATSLVVTFDEPIKDGSSLDASDLSVVGSVSGAVAPDSIVYDANANTLTLDFANLSGDQTFTVTLNSGAGSFEDRAGNALDGDSNGTAGDNFTLTFGVDAAATALTGFTSVAPAGSLVYQAVTNGAVDFAGDKDLFTLDLDAGQTVAVVLNPAGGLIGTVELVDANGTVIGSATSSAADARVLLQATAVSTAGTNTLRFSGESSTTGTYAATVYLNATAENENHGGTSNDSIETAQNLDGSFFAVGQGATQVSIVGGMPRPTATATFSGSNSMYRNGSYGQNSYTTVSGTSGLTPTGDGTVTVTANGGGYNYGSTLEVYSDGNYLGGFYPEYYNTGSTSFTVSQSTLQSWISDGSVEFRMYTYQYYPYGNYNFTLSFPYSQTVESTPDYYGLSLSAGETASVSLKQLTGSGVTLALFDSNGVKVIDGAASSLEVDSAITNFVAPAAGTYYLKVTPTDTSEPTYNLAVTKNSTFDVGANDTVETAQDITVTGRASGAITSGESDFYTFQAKAGDALTISTSTFADGAGEFLNGLDATLELFDSAGNSLATSTTTAGNLTLTFAVPADGTYVVKVGSANDTTGEYVVNVSGATGTAPAFLVASTSIISGSQLSTAPSTIVIDFNHAYSTLTVDASDLTLTDGTTGYTATAVTQTDADTLEFTLPALPDGDYTYELAAGALKDLQGTDLSAYTAAFHLDTTGPLVTSTSIPQDGTHGTRSLTYTVTFNEDINEANIDPNDFTLQSYELSTGTYTASTTSSGRAYNWNTVYPTISTNGPTPSGDVTFSVTGTGYNGYWYTNPGYFRFYDEAGNQRHDQAIYAYNTQSVDHSWTVSAETYAAWAADNQIGGRIEWYAIDHSITYTVSYPYSTEAVKNTYAPAAYSYDPSTRTLTLDYTGLTEDQYKLTLKSGDGEFEDVLGTNLDGNADNTPGGDYIGRFTVEYTSNPLLGGFTALTPSGSLVYQGNGSANIATQSDTDDFTVLLDAGQTVSVLVDPVAGLQATIEVLDSNGVSLGTATASSTGAKALLNSAAVSTAGQYTVRIGSASGSGDYSFKVYLNTAVESENQGGDPNDDTASARDLDGSFASLGGDSSRGAVIGGISYTQTTSTYNRTISQGQYYDPATGGGTPNVYFNFDDVGGYTPTGDASVNVYGNASWARSYYTPSQSITYDESGNTLNNYPWYYWLSSWSWNSTSGVSASQLQDWASDGNVQFNYYGYNTSSNAYVNLSFPYTSTVVGSDDYYKFSLQPGQSAALSLKLTSGSGVSLDVFGENGALVTSGTPTGTDQSDVVTPSFRSTAGGTFYVRVKSAGTSALEYALVATKSATFDAGSNDAFDTAQDLTLSGRALGFVDGSDSDFFKFDAASGNEIVLSTSTPGSELGEFNNTLDPTLELIDSDGTTVLQSSSANGNESITFTIPTTGTYYVRVAAGNGTSGEYTVGVTGASPTFPALEVASSSITSGMFTNVAPTAITVTFNRPLNLATISADALTVDGVAATGFVIDSSTSVTFTLPSYGEGLHDVALNTGTITDLNGTALSAFSTAFTFETVPPKVESTSVASGELVTTPDFNVTLTFDEAIRGADLDLTDFVINGSLGYVINPTSVVYDEGSRTATLTFATVPEDDYTLVATSGVGAIADLAGNALDGDSNGTGGDNFNLSFTVDHTTAALPTLVRLAPAGAQIYAAALNARIPSGDVGDDYTVNLDAGQLVTLSVLPTNTNTLQPSVELIDPQGISLGSITSGAAGLGAALHGTPVGETGTYTIRVTGTNGTTGDYALHAYLNASEEEETYTGTNNDSTGQAQNLDTSVANFRAAVVGTINAGDTDVFVTSQDPGQSLHLTLALPSGSDATLELLDTNGNLLSEGKLSSDSTSRSLTVVLPTSGNYYVRVTGTSGSGQYSLVAQSDGTIESEPNDTPETAVDLNDVIGVLAGPGTGRALGFVDSGDTDLYRISAVEGDTVSVVLAIPGADSGEFINNLNGSVELLDSNGTVVASSSGNAGDETFTYTIPSGAAGAYLIRVTGEDGTTGEYDLQVAGVTKVQPAFFVQSLSITDGQRLTSVPTQLTVTFNEDIFPYTIEVSDLKVDGNAAAYNVTRVDARTVTFDLNALPDGTYNFQFDAAAFTSRHNIELAAFSSQFIIDQVGPTITSASITPNQIVAAGDVTFSASLSEAINGGILSTDDFVLVDSLGNTYGPSTISYVDGSTTLDLTFASLPGERTYTLTIRSAGDAVTDLAGNTLDGNADGTFGDDYTLNFAVNDAAVTFPALTKVGIDGTAVYTGSTSSTIDFADDTDSYTLDLDADQTLTLVLSGTTTLNGQIELIDPNGSVVSTVSTAAGSESVVQTFAVSSAGTYTLRVSGLSGTTGDFTLTAYLNAAVESESHIGTDNSTFGSAQDLDGSFVTLPTGGFVTTVLGSKKDTTTTGTYDVTTSAYMNGSYGSYDYINFYLGDATDKVATGPGTVYFSHDGQYNPGYTFYTYDENGTNTYNYSWAYYQSTLFNFQVSQENLNNWDNDGQYFFQARKDYYTSYPRGTFYAQLTYPYAQSVSDSTDVYSFTLGAGQSSTIALKQLTGSGSTVEFYDANNVKISEGVTVTPTADGLISDIVSAAGGTFYAKVTNAGDNSSTYALSVTKSASLDAGDNNTSATAQDITVSGAVIGHTDAADEDFFTFSASVGDALSITLGKPGSGTGEFVNGLDVAYALYSPSGTLVESGSGEVVLSHAATETGRYTLKISADNNTTGEYTVGVTGNTRTLVPFTVTSVSIADGTSLTSIPTEVTVTFNVPFFPGSENASDLTVDGVEATSVVVVDPTTLRYTLPTIVDGGHTITLAAALSNLQGTNLTEFVSNFYVDTVGPKVVSTTAPDGGTIDADDLTYTVTFDEDMDPSSIDPSDFTLQSIEQSSGTYSRTIYLSQYYDPASGSGNADVYFNFDDVSGYTPTGPASINVYGNASWYRSYYTNSVSNYYDENGSQIYGYPWSYWTSSWSWNSTTNVDQSQMQTWAADGNVQFRYYGYNSSSNAYATLSFPYQTTTVKNTYEPTSYSYDESTRTLTLSYAALPEDQYRLTLKSGADQFQDYLGNALDGDNNDTLGGDFVTSFYINNSPKTFPATTVTGIAGTQVYQTATSGSLDYTGDKDEWTIDLDAGQTMAILASGDAGVTLDIEVVGPDGSSLGGVTSTSAGATALLQNVSAELAGTYTVRVTDTQSAKGGYTIRAFLNTALEGESNGGGSNDSLAEAQDLDTGFTTTGGSAARAAVSGGISYEQVSSTYNRQISQYISTYGGQDAYFSFDDLVGYTPTGPATINFNGSSSWYYSYNTISQTIFYNDETGATLYNYPWNYWTSSWSYNNSTELDQSTFDAMRSDGTASFRYYGYNQNGTAYANLSFPYTNTIIGSDDYYSFTASAGETVSLGLKLSTGSGVELSLYDAAGTKIASGAASGTLDQALSNYVVPATGTYYARVKLTGTEALTYDLSVAKDAVVDNGANTTVATAQNINAAGGAIGSLNGTDSGHYYFYATEGDNVTLSLATPGSDAGEFVNNLDASLELYDESGTLLATSDGAAELSYTATTTGKVIVKVSSESSTAGEYSLKVSGYTKVTSPLTVTSSSLTSGSYLPAAPTEVTVTFSDTIDLSSVNASDLTINGAEAISFSIVDGQTVKFFLPNLTDGEQTITLAAGAVTALDGAGLSEFTQVFTLDRVAPIVSSTSVEQNGVVPQGPLTVDVVFNEPLFDGGAGIGVEDITLVGSVEGAVAATGATYNASNQTLTVTFPSLAAKQTFVLTLANSAFVDRGQITLDGNADTTAGDDFTLNFAVRAPAVAFPTPLTAINPLGGLVYTGEATGNLSFTLDSDDYDLNLDAGQTVTLVMNPAAGMTGKVSLVDYTGTVIGTATGTGDGATVVLNTVATTQGVYTLRYASTNGTGVYTGKVYLNAAVENESNVGTDNSDFANAQDLDGAFATLPGGTGSRAVVVGSIDPTTTTGTFTASTFSSGTAYNWTEWYPSISATFPTPTGDATFSIEGTSYNGYWYTNPGYFRFYDEAGSERQARTIYAYNTESINTSWNVDQATVGSWIADGQIGGRVYLYALNHNVTYAVSYPYSQTSVGNDDFYKITLAENEVASVSITGLTGSSPSIELYDAEFNLVTLGETKNTNVAESVTDFVAPASGTYYIKVKSAGDTDTHGYSVVVTKGASFDVESNDSAETAQNITLTKTALGHLGADDGSDYYTLEVGDTLLGQGATDPLRLNLQTLTPGGGTGEFVNTLDAKIELYDSTGTLLSSNDNGSNDRRNAKLGYNVTTPGTYTVRVTNVNNSAGEYVLDAKVVPLTAGVTITPTDGLITTESAGTDSFTVVLNTQPTADVTVTLSSSNVLEGTIDLTEIVFTSENWNVARTVTVTGVNDDSVDGDQSLTITSVVTSTDAAYNGLTTEIVGVVNQDDDAAGVTVTPTSGLEVNETGTTATFNVELASKPTADVTVSLLSGNLNEATTDVSELIFTPENWNIVQTVTVTGVNDDSVDGAQEVTISTSVTTTDTDYASIDPADVTVTNYDDDVAGFTVSDTTGLTTTEAGATASFTVMLTSKPASNVVLDVSSSNTGEGSTDVTQIVFTPEDWNQPHTVIVTGANDDTDDGDQTYSVDFTAAASDDVNYDGLTVGSVALTNTDDDTAGVTVTPTDVTTTEAGGTASFDIVLTSKPTADVIVSLGANAAEGTLSDSTITFTPDNWNVARTITVTGVDDLVDDGNVTYAVTTSVTSDDAAYAGVDPADVSVTNTDDDTAGVTVTPTSGLVTSEQGASTSFGVKLTSKPLSPVTITFAGDATEGTLSTNTLTFTPEDWNVAQSVTVTGVDDIIGDGDVTYGITQTITSTDTTYNGLTVAPVPVTNTGDEALDITGPRVTKVIVGSSAWTNAFRNKLDASGLGYAITVGTGNNQLLSLPWSNLNRISVVFDEGVVISSSDFKLAGRNIASYGINSFIYNPATKTATWTLATSISNDKLYIGVGDSVADITGNALDGEWANPTARNAVASDTFPSGNGTAGGDFLFRFNVVPADFDGNGTVAATDTNNVRNRVGQSATSANYSVFADLNGSGVIDTVDLTLANGRTGSSLPLLDPTVPLV